MPTRMPEHFPETIWQKLHEQSVPMAAGLLADTCQTGRQNPGGVQNHEVARIKQLGEVAKHVV